MTVSPRWPQDDAAASSADDHQLAANNGVESSMPPTLFRLPNLNPAPATPVPASAAAIPADGSGQQAAGHPDVGHAAVAHSSGNAIHSQPASPPVQPPVQPPTQPNAISPAAADAAAMQTQTTEATPSPEPTPAQTFHQRPAPVSEAPAGRSWMEVTRQHGVVVMLLLIVVATAVFTGRDTTNGLADDAIADGVELGQIDQGIASDVPLPVHRHDTETGVAASQHSFNPAPGDVGAVSTGFDPAVQTNDAMAANDTSTSFASLEPPQVNMAKVPAGTGGDQQTAEVTYQDSSLNEVAAIEFVPPQVDAQTVANRVADANQVDSDVAFNPPSLESLSESLSDGEPNLSAEMSGVHPNSFVPVSSKTPGGISNWLKFLPALPNDTSN